MYLKDGRIMFEKKNFYLFNGLYLDEAELNAFNIKKSTTFDVVVLLQDYDQVYTLRYDALMAIDKDMAVKSFMDNKMEEVFYTIKNDKFIVLPIQIYYGIRSANGQLIACYSDEKVRDAKIAHINKDGINSIISDISSNSEQIAEYHKHKKLIKTYNSLVKLDK